MEFDDFCNTHQRVWTSYLDIVSKFLAGRRDDPGKLFFPNLVLYTETNDHYIAELFGCALRFAGLKRMIHKESSTSRYFHQFGETSENVASSKIDYCDFRGMIFSHDIDIEKVKTRFGFNPCKIHGGARLVITESKDGPIFSLGKDLHSVSFNNCLVINNYEQFYRMKSILHLSIAIKSLDLKDFVQQEQNKLCWPVDMTDKLVGITAVRNDDHVEAYKLSSQFTNMFMVSDILEPQIGKFLHKNPDIIQKALRCSDLLYETRFRWFEGNPNPSETYIQPDFILKSCETNYWDICDLKKPLFNRRKITKGEHSRRRFIDDVNEGIAQLANYEQYFSFSANANYARERYSVEVKSPKLILIIGNFDNYELEEVKEASRSINENFSIIDYDSLNILYLAATVSL